MEYAEGQSRRSNVVLDGIGEEPGETWEQTEEKVKDILVDKLKLQRGIEIERAHRTGKPAANNTRPRPIVVKFLRFKVRSAVLERDKNLRGTNIYINEDYTDTVRMKRKELLPKLWEVRERDIYLPLDGGFVQRGVVPVVSGVHICLVEEQQRHHLRRRGGGGATETPPEEERRGRSNRDTT
ncbi:hypothetical protein NHX12_024537 [Muraenolepis orangiensis]|uniref:Uncharacterized protein n=1 Tax=Muraenolepis orangiensis TaxID=630683 RepID=A0A9Q0EKJ5_9TELE|nr:hypothetical protein NHX12_024537 [Muraenolepis orangiensis]